MSDAVPADPVSPGEVRWGILATGTIAQVFTTDLLAHGHRVEAVGSRSLESAHAFAEKFGIPRAHGSYDELVSDPDLDVVYIATPHNFHARNAAAALNQGKHVLVEKAFTVNAAQAQEVVDLARRHGLLVMEAMWTRFLPHMAFVREVVRSGRIGSVTYLHADHSQRLSSDPSHRLNNPQLGGGALLDLGVYPVSFAHDILGPPTDVAGYGVLKDTGVDGAVATMFRHRNGALSTSYSTSDARGPNSATVVGTGGRIEIAPVWLSPAAVTVYDARNEVIDRFDQRLSGRGMQYQAAEVERVLSAGETASPLMTPDDSIAVMAAMDKVRSAIGVRYPDE